MGTLYNAKSRILSFVSDIRIYKGGFILFGDSHYKIKGPETRAILNVIEPGDILLRRYSNYLGSKFIPGYYSHVAIYVGENTVVHMLGSGIVSEDILTFLRCDDICVLRSKNRYEAEQAVINVYKHLEAGVPYDYNFDHDSAERFYCTELIDNCYDYKVKKLLNKRQIMPDDFLALVDRFFHIVWVRDKEK